jgi:ribosomal protein S19
MPRSIKKGPYIPYYLKKNIEKINKINVKPLIKT